MTKNSVLASSISRQGALNFPMLYYWLMFVDILHYIYKILRDSIKKFFLSKLMQSCSKSKQLMLCKTGPSVGWKSILSLLKITYNFCLQFAYLFVSSFCGL